MTQNEGFPVQFETWFVDTSIQFPVDRSNRLEGLIFLFIYFFLTLTITEFIRGINHVVIHVMPSLLHHVQTGSDDVTGGFVKHVSMCFVLAETCGASELGTTSSINSSLGGRDEC